MDKAKQYFKRLESLISIGFKTGFIIGVVYFGYNLRWFWTIYPLSFLGIQNRIAAGLIISVVFSISVFIMAIWWGIAGLFIQRAWEKTNSKLFSIAAASIFTLAEFIRATFFSIFWLGSGSIIGPYWPLGNIGYFFSDFKPISFIASSIGIYGITFIISCLIFSILFTFNTKKEKSYTAIEISTIILTILFLNYLHYRDSNKEELNPIPIAVIQTDVPSDGFTSQEQALKDFKIKLQLLEQAAQIIKKGIIVFPEGTNISRALGQFLDTDGIEKYFKNLSKEELIIIDSVRTSENDKFTSRAIAISSQNGVIGTYDKQVLTPGGEFLPYIVKLPLLLISPYLRDQFKTYREYSSGSGSNIIDTPEGKIKILICSEVISPVKAQAENQDFNIIMGSFSVWGENQIIPDEFMSMAKFRAIETGKYTVLSSNYGKSYILTPAGEIQKITSFNSYELLTGEIVPNKNQTWYNYLGDWPIFLLSLAIFGLFLRENNNDTKG